MRRDQLPPHKTATYVMPAYRAVYVSVPKAACTSLKWLVAGIQGEDPQRFHRSLSREVAPALTIHRRGLWRRTPMLHELPEAELEAVSPENGWFVFAVVRHPAARLWSGWQSKFLLREPRWMDEFAGEPWLPRVPASTRDVREDFEAFATSIAANRDQAVMRDRHFMPQTRLLGHGRTPYTRVYETREIPQLLDDLGAHLRAQGREGSLELMRANETPLPTLRAVFTPAVREAVEALYAGDFEAFGYADTVPPKAEAGDAFAPEAIAEVGRLVERHERIGDLARRAQALAQQNRALRGRTAAAAPSPVRAVVGRVRRKLSAGR